MRISTAMMDQPSIDGMKKANDRLLTIQKELSSGKKVSVPSDNPMDYVSISQKSLSIQKNEQFMKNGEWLESRLSLTDTALSSITDIVNGARDLVIQAQNGTLDKDAREAISLQIKGMTKQLAGVMNTKDSNGEYIFSGQNNEKAAYQKTGIDANGEDIYGYFGTNENGRKIAIGSIENTTTDPNLVESSISGKNAFSVTSGLGNNHILDTLRTMATDLSANNVVNMDSYLDEIDQTLNNVSLSRTQVGVSINQKTYQEDVLTAINESHEQVRSDLQDTDMVKSSVEMNKNMVMLQAAQKAYSSTQNMSLFNYLK